MGLELCLFAASLILSEKVPFNFISLMKRLDNLIVCRPLPYCSFFIYNNDACYQIWESFGDTALSSLSSKKCNRGCFVFFLMQLLALTCCNTRCNKNVTWKKAFILGLFFLFFFLHLSCFNIFYVCQGNILKLPWWTIDIPLFWSHTSFAFWPLY